MLSNHLILYCLLLLLLSIFSSIRVFSNESALRTRWPAYWSFSFHVNEYSALQWIFRVDFLLDGLVRSPCCSRGSQESSTSQFESIISSALSLLYGLTLTSVHDYWKSRSFNYMDFCCKVMSLIFNTLSGFVIDFLPRSNCLCTSIGYDSIRK